MTVKTDRNDAHGIAQIVRTGWFKTVHLKSAAGQRLRSLTAARKAAERAQNVTPSLFQFSLPAQSFTPPRQRVDVWRRSTI
jgi:hypothetical protein